MIFEGQMAIAPLMGFPIGRLRAVERFMKRYYLAARDVGNLTRIICAAVETDFSQKTLAVGRGVSAGSKCRSVFYSRWTGSPC